MAYTVAMNRVYAPSKTPDAVHSTLREIDSGSQYTANRLRDNLRSMLCAVVHAMFAAAAVEFRQFFTDEGTLCTFINSACE
jgi:hypothetical protein